MVELRKGFALLDQQALILVSTGDVIPQEPNWILHLLSSSLLPLEY